MTVRAVLAIALAIAAAGSRAATAGPLRAEPQVAVIVAPVNGTAAGPLVLHNDAAANAIDIGAITAEPGCDAGVQLAPAGAMTLSPGSSRSLIVNCAAAPAGMQRCNYRVRSPTQAVLLDLEAVCAHAGATTLSPDATDLSFGAVNVGASLTRTITLGNTGTAAIDRLFLETTDLAGHFAIASPCNPDGRECDAPIASLPAGATRQITVACTPRTAETVSAQLFIVSGTGTRLAAPITLSCTGVETREPVLSASPTAIDVGAVEVLDGKALATVHLSNAGGDMLRLLDVQIVDGGTGAAADWKVTAHSPCTAGIPPGCLVGSHVTTDLDLVFDPSAIAARNATLLIQYRDTADRSTSIPLRGTGRGATLDLIGGPTALDFGTLPLGESAALDILIANRGTRDLTGATITVAPRGPPFSVAPAAMFNVSPTAPTKLTVTCTATTGLSTATLTLAADDVESPPIELDLRCTGDTAAALVAKPPALLLGEVRLDTPRVFSFEVTAAMGTASLQGAALQTPIAGLTLRGLTPTTPATLDLLAAPEAEGRLTNQITVSPTTGQPAKLAVSGTAVTADFAVPPVVSLGTFCIGQPTTPRVLRLTSTATATIGMSAPTLQSPDSGYDLELIVPTTYPAVLAPFDTALIAATPKRSATPGTIIDSVIWKTDVNGKPTTTMVMATFVEAGGAIAPAELSFEPAPIHLATANAQEVALKNCDASPLQLDPPVVPAPFSIDSPNFPSVLAPRETTTFSVGFHPTRVDPVTRTLVITSPQLHDPLFVTMSGRGRIAGDDEGGGSASLDGPERTSFYACGGCTSGDTSGLIAFGAAALLLVRRRR